MKRGLFLLVLALPFVAVAAPDPPSSPSPPDGSVAVPANPSLCVNVSDPQGGDLAVTFYGRDLSQPPGEEFELIVLPDTQLYSQMFPSIYFSQTAWIAENRKARNIVFVSHVGDIVELAAVNEDWVNASAAMALLEDPATTELAEGLPYGLSVGNHDQEPSGRPGTLEDPGASTPLFNEWFGLDRFEDKSWFGGHWGDNNDNSYQLFEAGGMKFIIFHLELNDLLYTPELLDLVLDWVEELLDTYSDRRAMLTTHTLLCNAVTCPLTLYSDFSVQGQVVYDRLKDHPNLFLMLCGHAGVSSQQPRRVDTFEGNTIHTTMQNYQRGSDCPYPCGRGYLRIYKFRPALDRIENKTYSPWLDEYKNDPCTDGSSCHEFELDYDMDGGIQFETLGSLPAVPSGMSACANWPGRLPSGDYEWYATASDGSQIVASERWTFDSNGSCTTASDCDDGDACTEDVCPTGTCAVHDIPNCCVTDTDCDDENYCTDDACNGGTCEHSDNTLACSDHDPCSSGDVCQNGACVATPVSCDDGNGCTTDSCDTGVCSNEYDPSPGCCNDHGQCDDGARCTADSCEGTSCVNQDVAGCCDTLADCSDDGDECTIEACPVWNGHSLYFDGINDLVTMYEAPGLGLTEFTLEAWFRWDGGGTPMSTDGWTWAQAFDTGGIQAYPLVTKGVADQEFSAGGEDYVQNKLSINYFLGIAVPDAEYPYPRLAADFEEHPSGSGDWAVNHAVFGETPVTIDEWHHAAATYDGVCWQLYLDGEPQTDGTNCPAEPPAWETLSHFGIGTALDKNGGVLAYVRGQEIKGYFSGLIDEVRVWDRGLANYEIVENMNQALVDGSGLVARWGLDSLMSGSEFLTEDSVGQYPGVVVGDKSFSSIDFADLGGGTCEVPIPLPAEVAGLSVEEDASTLLSWVDQGAGTSAYDVASGLVSQLHDDGGLANAACLADDLAATNLDDDRPDPPSGDGYYYVVRAVADCGNGSYGLASDGGERIVPDACP